MKRKFADTQTQSIPVQSLSKYFRLINIKQDNIPFTYFEFAPDIQLHDVAGALQSLSPRTSVNLRDNPVDVMVEALVACPRSIRCIINTNDPHFFQEVANRRTELRPMLVTIHENVSAENIVHFVNMLPRCSAVVFLPRTIGFDAIVTLMQFPKSGIFFIISSAVPKTDLQTMREKIISQTLPNIWITSPSNIDDDMVKAVRNYFINQVQVQFKLFIHGNTISLSLLEIGSFRSFLMDDNVSLALSKLPSGAKIDTHNLTAEELVYLESPLFARNDVTILVGQMARQLSANRYSFYTSSAVENTLPSITEAATRNSQPPSNR